MRFSKSLLKPGLTVPRLSNYYVHPTCTPTRAALMTGKYAANVGLSLAMVPGNPVGLSPEYTILPEHLSKIGYKNYLVGKWHLGQSKIMYHPLRRGFDEFYGLLGKIFWIRLSKYTDGGFNKIMEGGLHRVTEQDTDWLK